MRIIIPALNYPDLLAVTLPAWLSFVPDAHIDVVTHGWDLETSDLVANRPEFGKPPHRLNCYVTPAWHRDGALLNKAAALDEAIGNGEPGLCPRPPADGEVCIVADADVVPFGTLPDLQFDTLYGCARYRCDTPERLDAYRSEVAKGGHFITPDRHGLPLIPPRRRGGEPEYDRGVTAQQAAEACTGYFQAFRYRPGLTFGSYPTAAGYDSAFRSQFTRCVGLTDFYVLHLGELSRENWKGRVVPPWPAGAPA